MDNRKNVLLRAAYDLLTKCDKSHFVLDASEVLVRYDGADCDGSCLRQDIAAELGIDENTKPISVRRRQ